MVFSYSAIDRWVVVFLVLASTCCSLLLEKRIKRVRVAFADLNLSEDEPAQDPTPFPSRQNIESRQLDSLCNTRAWGLSARWEGYIGIPPFVETAAVHCCFPPAAAHKDKARECNSQLLSGEITSTFGVRAKEGSPVYLWSSFDSYNVKLGVEFANGMKGMLRYCRHCIHADYFAYVFNSLIGLHNTPITALRYVDAAWFLKQMEGRPFRPDTQEHRDHFTSLINQEAGSDGKILLSVQNWVEGATGYRGEDGLPYIWPDLLRNPYESNAIPDVWRERLLELSDVILFDFLIYNRDRFHSTNGRGRDLFKYPLNRTVGDHCPNCKRKDKSKRLFRFGLDRMLATYNLFTYFPGGPTLPLDQSDALLDIDLSARDLGKRTPVPLGNQLPNVCVFRGRTISKLLELAEMSGKQWRKLVLQGDREQRRQMKHVLTYFGAGLLPVLRDRVHAALVHVDDCLVKFPGEMVLIDSL